MKRQLKSWAYDTAFANIEAEDTTDNGYRIVIYEVRAYNAKKGETNNWGRGQSFNYIRVFKGERVVKLIDCEYGSNPYELLRTLYEEYGGKPYETVKYQFGVPELEDTTDNGYRLVLYRGKHYHFDEYFYIKVFKGDELVEVYDCKPRIDDAPYDNDAPIFQTLFEKYGGKPMKHDGRFTAGNVVLYNGEKHRVHYAMLRHYRISPLNKSQWENGFFVRDCEVAPPKDPFKVGDKVTWSEEAEYALPGAKHIGHIILRKSNEYGKNWVISPNICSPEFDVRECDLHHIDKDEEDKYSIWEGGVNPNLEARYYGYGDRRCNIPIPRRLGGIDDDIKHKLYTKNFYISRYHSLHGRIYTAEVKQEVRELLSDMQRATFTQSEQREARKIISQLKKLVSTRASHQEIIIKSLI